MAIEQKQNRVNVAEIWVSVENCVDACGKEKNQIIKRWRKKRYWKRLREVMLIYEKTQLPSLRKVNTKELKETVELVNSVTHNGITNSITEMNNLLYAGA